MRAASARLLALGLMLAPGSAARAAERRLSADEVRAIVARAAGEAQRLGARATIAVVDAEGAPLAVFRMDGAAAASVVEGQAPRAAASGCGREGLEGLALPSEQVALTKAGTAALLSTAGQAFSTRTLAYLVQPHFPPGIDFTAGGPLFGLQHSSLPCSDVRGALLPLGLSADPGGLPLYRDDEKVGGLGVEGDGVHGAPADAFEDGTAWEEQAALAGASGFEPPAAIRAVNVLLDGIRLPFASGAAVPAISSPAGGQYLVAPRAGGAPPLVPAEAGGLRGWTLPAYPLRAGSLLTTLEVERVLAQAAGQAARTRSALRHPLNSAARVSVAVVDAGGAVLGFFAGDDAAPFSRDAAVQAARTAAFFSGAGAGEALRRAGQAAFIQEVALDGTTAFTSRAVGFLAQPFLPPGIPGTEPGPFSVAPPPVWSAFHTGLQVDLLCDALGAALAGVGPTACTGAPGLANGIAIAPGGAPLYKDGRLAGAVGVSGDGPDQDDLVAGAGAAGLEAPAEKRSDRLLVRGVRLPYLKFPRHPDL